MTKTIISLLLLTFFMILTASQGCDPKCSSSPGCCVCSTDISFCYSCTPGYSYATGVCYKNACHDSNCELCEKDGSCFRCSVAYQLAGTNCNAITCGSNCQSCLDNNTCLRCSTGYTKTNGQCVWSSNYLYILFFFYDLTSYSQGFHNTQKMRFLKILIFRPQGPYLNHSFQRDIINRIGSSSATDSELIIESKLHKLPLCHSDPFLLLSVVSEQSQPLLFQPSYLTIQGLYRPIDLL